MMPGQHDTAPILTSGAAREAGQALCSAQPTMLLWGVPIPLSSPSACALRRDLVDVLDRLGEKPTSRSEPDGLLDLGAAGLVIVEVKVHSGPNMKEPDYAHWDTYLGGLPFDGDNAIRESGFYELARYWRIGWDLAEDRPFAVFSLGPADLFARNDLPAQLASFQKGLATQERHRVFRVVDWPAFLKPAVPLAGSWFRDYCRERGIWSPSDSDEEH